MRRRFWENIFWQSLVEADDTLPEGQSALLPERLAMLSTTDPVAHDAYGYLILAVWMDRSMDISASNGSKESTHETSAKLSKRDETLVSTERA
jgi:hypothetical protein